MKRKICKLIGYATDLELVSNWPHHLEVRIKLVAPINDKDVKSIWNALGQGARVDIESGAYALKVILSPGGQSNEV